MLGGVLYFRRFLPSFYVELNFLREEDCIRVGINGLLHEEVNGPMGY